MVSLIRKYQNVVVKAKNEIETLKEEVVKVEKKEVDLNQKFALLDDEDYVVTYARANYIFKRDNEVVAKISQVEE